MPLSAALWQGISANAPFRRVKGCCEEIEFAVEGVGRYLAGRLLGEPGGLDD